MDIQIYRTVGVRFLHSTILQYGSSLVVTSSTQFIIIVTSVLVYCVLYGVSTMTPQMPLPLLRRTVSVIIVLLLFTQSSRPERPNKSKSEKRTVADQDTSKTEEETYDEEHRFLPKEVLVIGAGMAGLAAARRLTADRQNFSVRVFEARRERYGGRVWTDKLTDMKAKGPEVELGGSSLNIISTNNPLTELADKLDLKLESVANLQFIVPWEQKSYSGAELSEVTRQAARILGQAINESRSEKFEPSVKEAIDKIIEKEGITGANSAGAHLVRCLPSYILDSYSTRHYRPQDLDVGYDKVLLDGMGELIDRLLSGSTEEAPLNLQLNKVARHIKVDKKKRKVVVRFRDGSQVTADMVVVAVPSSIIASGDLLFEPELPHKYKLALQEITMSAGDKVIVEFEHPFWPAEFGVFTRAVTEEADRGNLQTWINVHRLIGKPVLIGLILGQAALEFEKLSEEEAKELVMNTLGEMFGSDLLRKAGKLVRFKFSKWNTDPFSLGASTYLKVGADPGLWDTLAAPVCPYIYLAGEHTTFDGHGTLHGAYNSGVRAADQILSGLCETLRKEEERKKEEMRKAQENNNESKSGKPIDGTEDNTDESYREEGDNEIEVNDEIKESKDVKTEL